MDLNIMGDYRFNDGSHKSHFLDYMFVTNRNQQRKHNSHEFFVYENGKVSMYKKAKDVEERKEKVSILKKLSLDIDNRLQKAFIIYFENIDIDRDTLIKAVSNLCSHFIQKEADKSNNIDYVCAVSHFDQNEQCAHLHVLYQCKEDIANELPSAVCRTLRAR